MARQLAPEGRYYGKVIKQDVYSTKGEDGGTPYLGFDVLLTGRDNQVGKREDLEVPLKRAFSLWINSPANVKSTAGALRFLGFDDDDIFRLNPWHENHFSLVGKEVALDISHKANQQTDELQENIWLSRAKAALKPETSKYQLEKVAELFAAYQQDAKQKRVSKMSDEELAEAVKRSEEKAKQGETFDPNEFSPTTSDQNQEEPIPY